MIVGMTTAAAEKASVSMSEVRAWAQKRGLAVNPTGNLPTAVVDAFNKAHRSKQFVRPPRGAGNRP